MRKSINQSIKGQIMTLCISLIVGMILVFWLINGVFLEKYYISNKQSEFVKVHDLLVQEVEAGTLSQELPTGELHKLTEQNNMAVMVMDREYNLVYISARSMDMLLNQLQGYLFEKNTESVLEETDSYTISRSTDRRNHTEYIEMWGTLSDDYIFIMRSPLESIRTAVSLFNRFVAWLGVILILIGSIMAWYFSKRMTEPIMELAALSQKMANLDFDAKYKSDREDEIGVLGQSFNQMSEKLELTISGLKRANYELQQDIEHREKMENMRSEFLGNVSHELKTPIALIQGYAEGLKEVAEDEDSRNFYCDVIMDEADKMNRMVKNLLELNQLEYGEDDIHFERFDVVEMIRGVVESCEIMTAEKGTNVIFRQMESVSVWADQYKVEQVIRNYYTNAINHVGGDNVIEIKIKQKEEAARISVFNTGKPIPEEDMEQIWDKFYKVDKARTRAYGGNGIGLSIVKAIMESFHKPFGVNNYDNGVEFWFELDMK